MNIHARLPWNGEWLKFNADVDCARTARGMVRKHLLCEFGNVGLSIPVFVVINGAK